MRAHRKRFTTSSVRDTSSRSRGIKTYEGISRFSQSRTGMSMRREYVMDRWQKQGGKCMRCGQEMTLDEAVLPSRQFQSGTEPPVVHRKCPK